MGCLGELSRSLGAEIAPRSLFLGWRQALRQLGLGGARPLVSALPAGRQVPPQLASRFQPVRFPQLR